MVQAFIKISEQTNRVLNIVKAKYDLKDKSEAINVMAKQYEMKIMEPGLRPAYVRKALSIQKQTPIKVGSVEKLRERYE